MLSHTNGRPRRLTPARFHASHITLAMLAVAFLAGPVAAQDEQREPQPAQAQDAPQDDFHNRTLEYQGNIVVTAAGLKQLDVLAGTSVLEVGDIQANLAGQLGDVLLKLPGVSATSFSPGASRPVLRGFSGERVRVLIDGLGTTDVSNTSADHATTIDPLTAERIEVLRGPAVMLYGSQAIGGAVNVIDKRIPRRVPGESFHLDGMAAWGSAQDLKEGGASLDVPVADRFVVHANGSWRDTNDQEIGGFVVAPGLRTQLLADAQELADAGSDGEAAQLRAAVDQRGILPDSATRTWTANAGFAFIDGESTLGAAVGWYDTHYGVPVRPGGEEEDIAIDLRQFRADLRGELALGEGLFRKFATRIGYSDYTHSELEGGQAGTVFDVQAIEARAVLEQNDRGGWRGSVGGQYFFRDFLATGTEAYVPPNTTSQYALFALQEFGQGPFEVEAAGRFEATDVASQPLGLARSFTALSGAIGLSWEGEGGLKTGINLSRAARAPSAEELFADGPHVATQAFEVGDPDLAVEKAVGLEAYVRGRIGTAQLSLSAYRSWFDNYVFQAESGDLEDGLPVLRYLQGDATYSGIEGELSYPFYHSGAVTLVGEMRGDYIRATLEDGTPIPRIPPLSLLGAIEAQTEDVDARIEVQWFDRQTRLAAFETATAGFTLVNLALTWRPLSGSRAFALVLGADNLFDATGRRHASFTKDFVPLAGRNIKASLRFSF